MSREQLSKSQVGRLGSRLVQAPAPAQADLDMLHDLLADRSEILGDAVERVRNELGLSPSSRVKTTGTILDKLRRNGGGWLRDIQDLGGMRIVGDFDRRGQDQHVADLVALFAGAARPPKVIDRRLEPVQGYRAVHVIVFPQRVPIEIQVRTRWQHEWAEVFEKLADLLGRGIRYGEPPARPVDTEEVSPERRAIVDAYHGLAVASVDWAISTAEMIAVVEAMEAIAPSDPDLFEHRREVEQSLTALREALAGVRQTRTRLDEILDARRGV